jgi:Holliday junction resolvasome RuvABC endonuclease subunit
MIILVLDPGTSTGYCLVEVVENESANIYEYGFIDVDITSEHQGDHCLDLMQKIQELIDAHSVEHIAIEDYFFSRKFRNGCNVNGAFRTAIHILARQNSINYTILNISAWKTFVAQRSTPTREQKAKWGGEAAKKLFIQQALWDRLKFRFPNHSISEKTGKPIIFRYDIVDVVGQAVYYCGIHCAVPLKKIKLGVEPEEDVVFKKKMKKVFEYS